MASLSTALYNTAAGLKVFQNALAVTQNNVVNASTPGYARQVATLEARPFDISAGIPGGVANGPVQTTRSDYTESTVQARQSSTSYYNQQVSDLSTLESMFDLSAKSGVSGALNNLLKSFSQLSVNPNDTVSRQAVLDNASATADAFHQAAAGMMTAGNNLNSEARSVISQINTLAGQIAKVNTHRHNSLDGSVDAGVDAQLYADLENLSQLVGFTTLQQADGSISVYIGGQTPIVIGDQSFPLQADFSTPQIGVMDAAGKDITAQITDGQLGALIQERNTMMPSYLNDLDTLAGALADQVNNTLGAGVDQNGAAPSTNLFNYDPVQGAAYTMSVNPMTPDQVAAALPTAPGGNGNALALSALGSATVVNGYTFTAAFGNIGQHVGSDISNAQESHSTEADLLSQAQNLRNQLSGVSLDQEAATLLQFQQAYNATAKMLGIVSQLTQTLMSIFQPQVTG